ncbi:hypothetical protein [Persicitalea jodogahamensis]|uniref:Uncharacterized protein n=1 Tax=Persicitalea jodogahamensis TaxID=402147 RepID=A0A8J3GBP3_9BACT|nr:hypothetical protein [Persicitalea jodogahamensis]GHB83333.1 hypothetical protein GCM10007390_42920 [Persicitalea jodogahamensis]
MKIAFVVSFFDFRNDVRRVIAEVAKQHEVVVLGNPGQVSAIESHLPAGVEFRIIRERKVTAWNRVWERAYLLFKQIPKSENNYYLMQLFLASNAATKAQQGKALRILRWTKRLPKILPYDNYLDKLQYSSKTQLDDIDQFILYTSIADDYLLARLLRENRTAKVYVYSWDHACKNPRFSKRVEYLCWSEGTKEDVVELHGVPPSQIRVVGASQFCYIHEFLACEQSLTRSFPFDYIYFGCAVGIPELARQEVEVIRRVAEVMAECRPELTLVVRPYPVMKDWRLYDEIRQLPNLIFDEDFRNADLSVAENAIREKFEKIHFAQAFFHLGTTMGLEACFTETPSFILDFGYETTRGLSLYNFIHQYQNDRHLINLASQNAITSEAELSTILGNLVDPIFLELNKRVQSQYRLQSFFEFCTRLTDINPTLTGDAHRVTRI